MCLTGCAPKYLSHHIVPFCPERDLRSSSLFKVDLLPFRTVAYGDRSFSFAGPSVWNSPPSPLTRALHNLFASSSLVSRRIFYRSFYFWEKSMFEFRTMVHLTVLERVPLNFTFCTLHYNRNKVTARDLYHYYKMQTPYKYTN